MLTFKLPNRLELLTEPGSDSVVTSCIEFAQMEDAEYREETNTTVFKQKADFFLTSLFSSI